MDTTARFAREHAAQIRAALAAGLFDLEVRARVRVLEVEEMDRHFARAERLERLERGRDRELARRQ